jgi:multidrug efflux pump subunit AcrA (membrane-fusion protein)
MQQASSSGKSRRPSFAVLAAIATVALAGCTESRNAYVPPPPPKVVVTQPLQKPVTLYLELTGNTAPFRTVQLVARVQGYLETIDYKDGTAVTKGTQLFGIERDVYQAQLDQALAQLAHDRPCSRGHRSTSSATSSWRRRMRSHSSKCRISNIRWSRMRPR